MKCPDCAEILSEVSLFGSDKTYHCFQCGGFWIESWVVNGLTPKTLDKWRLAKKVPERLNLGSRACPVDNTALKRWKSEEIPQKVLVERCERCGRWWFPEDSLLEYKPALEAKENYLKLWGMARDAAAMALPLVILLTLIAGVVMAVQLVKERQQVAVPAYQAK